MSMFRMAALKSKGDPDLCAAAAMSSISASGGESLPVCRDTLSDGDNAAAGLLLIKISIISSLARSSPANSIAVSWLIRCASAAGDISIGETPALSSSALRPSGGTKRGKGGRLATPRAALGSLPEFGSLPAFGALPAFSSPSAFGAHSALGLDNLAALPGFDATGGCGDCNASLDTGGRSDDAPSPLQLAEAADAGAAASASAVAALARSSSSSRFLLAFLPEPSGRPRGRVDSGIPLAAASSIRCRRCCLRMAELYRFLMALSVRPGRFFTMKDHFVPCSRTLSMMIRSSSSVHEPLRTSGQR
mmetsp:Transcript_18079/g.59156  ORF Transcript_18079/g.59156 Transcript_18079/m.59156 type:complete len:305 (+) Transcript_18079:842-1756(+)